MSKYSKYNIVYLLQKWLDSVPGQTFLNYAYSWGAAIVIFGTLCKLTHLPGANFWLYLGMGTEVIVFFFSAFDRPFDKTADGKELKHGSQKEQTSESQQLFNDPSEDEIVIKLQETLKTIYDLRVRQLNRTLALVDDCIEKVETIKQQIIEDKKRKQE